MRKFRQQRPPPQPPPCPSTYHRFWSTQPRHPRSLASIRAVARALRADNFASDRVLQVSHDIPSLLSVPILVYICMANANGPWLWNWDDNGITVHDHSHLSGLLRALRADNFASDRVLQVSHDISSDRSLCVYTEPMSQIPYANLKALSRLENALLRGWIQVVQVAQLIIWRRSRHCEMMQSEKFPWVIGFAKTV